MPKNKSAQDRYRIIDRCLQERRGYTYEELIEKCHEEIGVQVSLRTIKKDIADMEMIFKVELEEPTGRKRILRYKSRHSSIFHQELSQEELSQLRETLNVLSRFKGLPQFTWMDELATNLEDKFLLPSHTSAIGFEQTEVKGVQYLKSIFHAIVHKDVLHIVYRSFNQEEDLEWDIHPYYIKQYNNRWFCFGLNNNEYRNLTHIALDRIVSLSVNNEIRYIPTDTDFEHSYFKDVIGVSVDKHKPVETVLLRFHPKRFPYVETKKLHPSQQTIDKEHCVIQLNVQINNELGSLILSFGNQVEVLQPQVLKEHIKEIIKEMLNFY